MAQSRRAWQVVRWIATKLAYGVWVALMILTPLFGFWLASSLAAYSNATQWLSLVIGLALFPILPVGWDLLYAWRRQRNHAKSELPPKPILTRLDRLVLRTLIVNGLFLGIMMWRAPHTAFRALAVRGDWILDGHDGPIANGIRDALLGFADHFERRWHTTDQTYGTSDKPPDPTEVEHDRPPPVTITDAAKPVQPADPNGWPLSTNVDPIVTAMPPEAQTSVEAVGTYLAAHIADKRQLVKALHDYVVLRLTYDVPTSLLSDAEAMTKRPSQEAGAVFAAKTAVCEGYARLFAALGKAAGLEVAYITGYIRDVARNVDAKATTDEQIKAALEGNLHAWNAVKLDRKWLLVDATWDDPVGGDDTTNLQSTYLFTPPHIFAFDHMPEEPAWQLLATPIGMGDFARQPLLNPYIGQLGVALLDPTRSQITADGDVTITLANPFDAMLEAEVHGGEHCTSAKSDGLKRVITCTVPAGQHEIRMYGAPAGADSHHGPYSLHYIGSILVNSR